MKNVSKYEKKKHDLIQIWFFKDGGKNAQFTDAEMAPISLAYKGISSKLNQWLPT